MALRVRRRVGTLLALARSHPGVGWDLALGVVGLVLFIVTWATVIRTHQVPATRAPLMAAMTVLPLALARRAAFVGWAASLLVGLFFWMTVDPRVGHELPWTVPQIIVLYVLMVAVALRERLRLVVVAWAVTLLVLMLVMPSAVRPGLAFGITSATIITLLLRWLVLSRRQLARQREVSDLERARRAVLEERSRIARDLHDVVAHRMSLVVVQAQSAPVRLGGLPDPVAEEFLSISEQARAALNEVRGMLGVLRSESMVPATAPQRGVGDVEELLRQTRDAGVDLAWEVHGDPTSVGEAVGMVLYRILQEALANASRHAPGSAVRVRVGYTDQVEVEVRSGRPASDTMPPGTAPDAGREGPGTGLIGMADRARSVGGRLEAGRVADGFLVQAWLPTTAHALVD